MTDMPTPTCPCCLDARGVQAIPKIRDAYLTWYKCAICGCQWCEDEAAAALRARPGVDAEPVAWMRPDETASWHRSFIAADAKRLDERNTYSVPLYSHPPTPAPPAQGAAPLRREIQDIDALRYRWLRDGCRSVRHIETMERILANWMEWTPREGDEAIDAAIAQGDTNAPANWLDPPAQPAEPGELPTMRHPDDRSGHLPTRPPSAQKEDGK